MSLEKLKVFSISSGLRPSPYYEKTGIPIPPRKIHCIGNECPVVVDEGKCRDDYHHLLFTAKSYEQLGGVYAQLQADPFMGLVMARCRHNSRHDHAMHRQYDFTPLPNPESSYAFLDESRLLRRLHSILGDLNKQIAPYSSGNTLKSSRANQPDVVSRKSEIINEQIVALEYCVGRVNELEVVPTWIFGNFLQKVTDDRKTLMRRIQDPIYPEEIQQAFT